jgi:hypothetical protein
MSISSLKAEETKCVLAINDQRQRVSTSCSESSQNLYGSDRLLELLRKEVIQPHLPVRLPCYDFTPIATPTFERSLPKGLSHVLRVLATFVV